MTRVSISYTVDLEEVPQRVHLLLEELATVLHSVANVSKDAAKKASGAKIDDFEGLKEIVRLRILLQKSLERTQDCFDILKDYYTVTARVSDASTQQAQQDKEVPQQEATPAKDPDTKQQKKKTKKKAKKKTTKKKAVKKEG